MSQWHDNLDSKKVVNLAEDFTADMYAKIIQSFCFVKDFYGCLVAMHGIAKIFGAYPDADVARLILEAVSNIPEQDVPTIRGRRRIPKQLTMSEQRSKSIANVIGALAERRALRRRDRRPAGRLAAAEAAVHLRRLRQVRCVGVDGGRGRSHAAGSLAWVPIPE